MGNSAVAVSAGASKTSGAVSVAGVCSVPPINTSPLVKRIVPPRLGEKTVLVIATLPLTSP
jgi:hypothetical protein